ncbi:MAG: hypothetical protein OXF62_19370 [Caldilineaceae bacterium]|nr:hypothetical protein [Caldilineaceae bacterium]
MNETTKQRDEKALNLLEAIGQAAVRVECAQNELGEIEKSGNEVAMRLRVVANCLDADQPERVIGILEGGMFLVEKCDEVNSTACEFWEADPSVRNVFRIPEGVMELMDRTHEAKKVLHTYEDMLNSLLRSYFRNCVGGLE